MAEGVKVNFLEVVEREIQPLQVRHVAERIPGGVGQLVVAQDQVRERSFNWLEEAATDLLVYILIFLIHILTGI